MRTDTDRVDSVGSSRHRGLHRTTRIDGDDPPAMGVGRGVPSDARPYKRSRCHEEIPKTCSYSQYSQHIAGLITCGHAVGRVGANWRAMGPDRAARGVGPHGPLSARMVGRRPVSPPRPDAGRLPDEPSSSAPAVGCQIRSFGPGLVVGRPRWSSPSQEGSRPGKNTRLESPVGAPRRVGPKLNHCNALGPVRRPPRASRCGSGTGLVLGRTAIPHFPARPGRARMKTVVNRSFSSHMELT